jgi:hypothetical protein
MNCVALGSLGAGIGIESTKAGIMRERATVGKPSTAETLEEIPKNFQMHENHVGRALPAE